MVQSIILTTINLLRVISISLQESIANDFSPNNENNSETDSQTKSDEKEMSVSKKLNFNKKALTDFFDDWLNEDRERLLHLASKV